MFVIGRLIQNAETASVEEYVALEWRWVSVPDMPTAVVGAAAVALDGKLLVIGGSDRTIAPLAAVLECDPADRSWKDLPRLPTARTKCTVTVLGGDVVVLGGYAPTRPTPWAYVASVERYDRRAQRWEAMPSLLDPLTSSAAVVVRV